MRRPDDAGFPRRNRRSQGHRECRYYDHPRKDEELGRWEDGLHHVSSGRFSRRRPVACSGGERPRKPHLPLLILISASPGAVRACENARPP